MEDHEVILLLALSVSSVAYWVVYVAGGHALHCLQTCVPYHLKCMFRRACYACTVAGCCTARGCRLAHDIASAPAFGIPTHCLLQSWAFLLEMAVPC